MLIANNIGVLWDTYAAMPAGELTVLGAWLGFGVVGVYMAQLLDWVVRSLCFIIRYRGTKWQHAAVE